MEKVFEIYIKTTPERLSKAITDGEVRRKEDFGAVVTPDGTTGSQYEGAERKRPFLEARTWRSMLRGRAR